MDNKLGVGFTGAGSVTQAIHLPTLARLIDLFQVRQVYDVVADVAARVAERVGAQSGRRPIQRGLNEGSAAAIVVHPEPASLGATLATRPGPGRLDLGRQPRRTSGIRPLPGRRSRCPVVWESGHRAVWRRLQALLTSGETAMDLRFMGEDQLAVATALRHLDR